jgi:hypothetical protein
LHQLNFRLLKLFYTIAISFVLLFSSFSNAIIYLNFKANQAEIAATLCVKKEIKDNTCKGTCYLAKQLKKAAEQEKKEAENLKEKQELVYIPSNSIHHLTSILSINRIKIPVFYPCEKPKSAQLGIFRPPLV